MEKFIAYLISVCAGLSTPWITKFLINLWNHFRGDIPRIEGCWIAIFEDPHMENNIVKKQKKFVNVKFKRFGRKLIGKGYIDGNLQDPFTFKAKIKRNSVIGSFERKKKHFLSGTGVFQLKITSDEKKMLGNCSWYDKIVDDIWTSYYSWQRDLK